jgi:hypothetical protein
MQWVGPRGGFVDRAQQARRGPARGRSRSGESGCGERDAASSPVPMDAGRISALLLARCETDVVNGAETCSGLVAGLDHRAPRRLDHV